MTKTEFDKFLEEELQDPDFVRRFEQAGEGLEMALKLAALRHEAGLSQQELARLLNTSQQQISPLETPGDVRHSMDMLRRVAAALDTELPQAPEHSPVPQVAETSEPYEVKGEVEEGGKRDR